MQESLNKLIEAEEKASILFNEMECRGYIKAGKTEKELNTQLYELAFELFGIRKFWHKRIVRSGKNTLCPYRENPENLTIQEEDILFFDFGPVFEEWEADFGRTYVVGNNPKMLKLKDNIESAWHEGKHYFEANRESITGAQFYQFTFDLAKKYGWNYGNEHCGHLIGNFPHEKLIGEETINYIHPDNDKIMSDPDQFGNLRHWIYEIHFTDPELQIGGFFEQLLA